MELDIYSYRSKTWYYIWYSHNYEKIKVEIYGSLSAEETLALHNIYCYNIFLEKCSFELSTYNDNK